MSAFVPKIFRDLEGIDAHVVPPGGFVAAVMQVTMMLPAERHGEVIADLSAEGPRLRETEMMRIARDGAA